MKNIRKINPRRRIRQQEPPRKTPKPSTPKRPQQSPAPEQTTPAPTPENTPPKLPPHIYRKDEVRQRDRAILDYLHEHKNGYTGVTRSEIAKNVSNDKPYLIYQALMRLESYSKVGRTEEVGSHGTEYWRLLA